MTGQDGESIYPQRLYCSKMSYLNAAFWVRKSRIVKTTRIDDKIHIGKTRVDVIDACPAKLKLRIDKTEELWFRVYDLRYIF